MNIISGKSYTILHQKEKGKHSKKIITVKEVLKDRFTYMVEGNIYPVTYTFENFKKDWRIVNA